MRQGVDGRWAAWTVGHPSARATGPTRERCLASLRRSVERAAAADGQIPGDPISYVVDALPQVVGVAEAAEIMRWDKRRVITYVDRGSFPEPVQTLASGRLWLRADVEAFAAAWYVRYRSRRPAARRRVPNALPKRPVRRAAR